MSCISFIDLNVNSAEQFKESISEPSPNTKVYLAIGRVSAWSNESSPDVANTSVASVYGVWKNMIGGKQLVGGDVAHVIRRHDWTANTAYTAYDHLHTDLYDANTQFVVVNSDFGVYKCISNNAGQISTIEPTSVNPTIVSKTSDGYAWKYMYTVTDAEQLRFTTENYIPVKTLTADDGSLQWSVQDQAIDGSIENVVITNGGNNYINANSITVTVTGDGSSFSGYATINSISNTVNSIVITDTGQNYTFATVTITDTGSGENASARAIISPPGGHGKNPLYELGGKDIMINVRLRYDEEGVLPVVNDFRQISLIKDPYLTGTSNVASVAAFLQTMVITTVGSGDYEQDEIVYQGASLAAAVFKGIVVSWDSTTGKLYLINTFGTPTASQSILGATSFTGRIIASVTEPTLEKYTGRILYMDNFTPITRAEDQIEDFKLLIEH